MTAPSLELRVGLFTLVGLVMLCSLILIYGEEPTWFWTTRWQLEILVNTPRGIDEGTPAFLQGVQIGRVERIQLKNPSIPSLGAAVVVEIDQQYQIPEGTVAKLHPSFGFDKGQIYLLPPAGETEPLPLQGAWIPGQTVGPLDAVVPQEFVQQLVVAVEEISKVGAVADQIVELLEPRDMRDVDKPELAMMANLSTAVQRLDETLRLFNHLISEEDGAHLRTIIANVASVTGELAEWSGQLDGRTQRLLDRADSAMASVETSFRDVGGRAAEAVDRLSSLITELQTITTAVSAGEGTVGLMVRDPRLYEELVDATTALKLALVDMRALITWIETESWLRRGL
jgi:phospholipid/cholesterol/gamma-HCH transport system substrate-binding protein